jgi:hypothetical protein
VVVEVHEQIAGLLGDPGTGGVGGNPGDVHAAGAVLDHDEEVEAAEEDGVDVGEVDREDRVGLRGQELSPGRAGALRGGVDASVLQDCPHGGGGEVVAESEKFALDAPVAPGRVLASHPQHQGPDRLWGGWAAWLASWVCPAVGDEVGVPAQQGSGRDEPEPAQLGGQQFAQRAEDGAVDPGQGRAWVVSAQYGDLVSEHQDLDVLGRVGAGEQRQPAQRAGEYQVRESKGHGDR